MSSPQSKRSILSDRWALLSLFGVVGACVVLGALGGLISAPAVESWYPTLEKPTFTPPSWVFGPVWTVLYALQGSAVWLVWRSGVDRRSVRLALGVFVVQFLLNLLWTPVFFGLRSPALGLVVIAALWIAIVMTIGSFWRVDRRAGWLLLPYFAWVSFATVLTYSIWTMN